MLMEVVTREAEFRRRVYKCPLHPPGATFPVSQFTPWDYCPQVKAILNR